MKELEDALAYVLDMLNNVCELATALSIVDSRVEYEIIEKDISDLYENYSVYCSNLSLEQLDFIIKNLQLFSLMSDKENALMVSYIDHALRIALSAQRIQEEKKPSL